MIFSLCDSLWIDFDQSVKMYFSYLEIMLVKLAAMLTGYRNH